MMMNPENPLWDEFIDRLRGPDGCNFRVEDGEDCWDCAHDFTKTRAILKDLGLTQAEIRESEAYFESEGGSCDCEILAPISGAVVAREQGEATTSDGEEAQEPPEPQRPRHVGIGLAAVALVLPVLSGSVLLSVHSVAHAHAIIWWTVIVSSLLLAIDAGRLGPIDLKGRQQGFALLHFIKMFLGMSVLWLFCYPIAFFFRRRHFGGPNLGIPAILVALFFVGAAMLGAVLGTAVASSKAALAYEKQAAGKAAEAIALYQEALAIDESQAGWWGNLGCAYWSLGRKELAHEAFRRALALQPTDARYRAALDAVSKHAGEQE